MLFRSSIAWGIVPADAAVLQAVTADELAERLCSLWSALAVAGVPAVALARQSLVTPACGLAGLTEAAAARAMRLCGEVAQMLRAEVAA